MHLAAAVTTKVFRALLGTSLLVGGALAQAGCHKDKPHEYGQQRPPVDQLDPRDRGLQSKDVVQASDKMAADLLADPNLNASREQWVVVVDRVENQTGDPRANLEPFLRRLRTALFQQGRGRVQLVENREKLRELQSRELESGAGEREPSGQGSGATHAPGPAGLQPDY